MIVTFCGHSDFIATKEHEQKILDFLEETVGNQPSDMYLGGYGGFDSFAFYCCKKFKETHPYVNLVFVSPYITEEYQRNYLQHYSKTYDLILYPEIENKPLKFAITYRNRFMVEKSDYVIAYVSRKRGGAYATYTYAKRKRERNL